MPRTLPPLRVVLTPDAVMPSSFEVAQRLCFLRLCPCDMGALPMAGTRFRCSCASRLSRREAWRLVMEALESGRFEH